MKNKLFRLAIFLILISLTILPACQPVQVADSYLALVPKVLYSGRTEAISLALFKGEQMVKDSVEIALLKDGRVVTSATATIDGKGVVPLRL